MRRLTMDELVASCIADPGNPTGVTLDQDASDAKREAAYDEWVRRQRNPSPATDHGDRTDKREPAGDAREQARAGPAVHAARVLASDPPFLA